MDDRALLRYSRHILLDEIGIEGQEKLLSSAALVIGCGGLGAAALPFLAAAGVGRLILADHDEVDETNLQRQTAFNESDIGRNKAEALKILLGTEPQEYGRLHVYNALSGRWQSFALTKNRQCRVCGPKAV